MIQYKSVDFSVKWEEYGDSFEECALSKIDNTMIYVVADAEYKNEISEILTELGY